MLSQDNLIELQNKVAGLATDKATADTLAANSDKAAAVATQAAFDAASALAAKDVATAKVASGLVELQTFVNAIAAV